MRAECRWILVGVAAMAVLRTATWAEEPDLPPKRARPPVWTRDVLDTFFDDARVALEGDRPDYESQANGPTGQPASAGGSAASGTQFTWSQLIDAATLETEVKRLHASLGEIVTTPTAFKAGGYKLARRDFSLLAVLFAVTGQYDGTTRWQDSAAGLRELFARAGFNAKVGTDQTYNEAKLRQQDLAELIRGGRPQVPIADVAADWGRVADRPPLMQRLELAHQERLTKWLADAASFRRHRDDLRHEAQIVAMLADVIGREGFDDWDEEEYAAHARDLKQSALAITAAADEENFPAARQAAARATKACTMCHDDYRG